MDYCVRSLACLQARWPEELLLAQKPLASAKRIGQRKWGRRLLADALAALLLRALHGQLANRERAVP